LPQFSFVEVVWFDVMLQVNMNFMLVLWFACYGELQRKIVTSLWLFGRFTSMYQWPSPFIGKAGSWCTRSFYLHPRM